MRWDGFYPNSFKVRYAIVRAHHMYVVFSAQWLGAAFLLGEQITYSANLRYGSSKRMAG